MAGESKKIREEMQDEEPDLSMTPMIDIIFQLLIFFMLACRFKTEEGQMHAFLPKNRGMGTAGTPAITLQEVRIKLLWCRLDSRRETTDPVNGVTYLKVKDRYFPFVTNKMGERVPDYNQLYHYIVEASRNFTPTRSYSSLPVIIDARPLVPFKHIIYSMNECVRAKITDITFAAPEIEY
jgi:hypothetical protein